MSNNSPLFFTSSNLADNAGHFPCGTRLRFCRSALNFSPTCLYKSTRVLKAVSRTVEIGSESSFTISGVNLLNASVWAPCLKICLLYYPLLKWIETYSFKVFIKHRKTSSLILAFLWEKQGVSFSNRVWGVSTFLSNSLRMSSWAFSRTVSLESPKRSIMAGRTVWM